MEYKNATNLTSVAAGTNCSFVFNIPKGLVVTLKFAARYSIAKNESLTYTDASGTVYKVREPVNNAIAFGTAPKVSIGVTSRTDNFQLYITYKAKQIAPLRTEKRHSGDIVSLGLLQTNFVSIQSNLNYFPTLSADCTDENYELELGQIMVFDGADPINGTFLGTLTAFLKYNPKPSSNVISLTTFYKSNFAGECYVLADDNSTVANYGSHSLVVTRKGGNLSAKLNDYSNNGALYTVYCTNCYEFYIKNVTFDSLGTFNTGYLNFRGMTPTHKYPGLLQYVVQNYTDNQMPQLIPSQTFTLLVYMSKVNIMFSTFDDGNWLKPYDERTGFIFAPSVWNHASSKSYDYNFNDSTGTHKFTVDMGNMKFLPGDSLSLKIGPNNGNEAVDNKYPQDKSSNGIVEAIGNHMRVQYQGTSLDSYIKFKIGKSSFFVSVLSAFALALFNALRF
ncbi:unnamed protein product [Caenorhabditis bovis]|uniref:CUB-like domain-containing protein n=1 Tax=Caenorhabditis bovis TaxID=2654633 RepID=A0A8S1EBN7_9PELO|nr:unnamed protein product [Caenorhabditis bovis]